MYRHRNRPKYTPEELEQVYSTPYDHTRWADHITRVEKTVEVGLRLLGEPSDKICWIADLSCGDAAIVDALAEVHKGFVTLGDFAPGYHLTGPIEETIDQIPHVDLFVCSETIEHLDDPDSALEKIRVKADRLLLTTPWMQWPDPNVEHYWAWDSEAVGGMLERAEWVPRIYDESYHIQEDGTPLGYKYQIWGCV